jgi:hypothetical protein
MTEGNVAEADRDFRESLDLRNQFLEWRPPNATIVVFYQVVLMKENKLAEADALVRSEMARAEPQLASYYATLLRRFGIDVAMKCHWQQAARSLDAVVKATPENSEVYHALAPVLVATGNISRYRQLCQEAILHFKDTQDPVVADQMAKDCLILPDSGADLATVNSLADVAVSRGTNSPAYPLFECCKALGEYRRNHFDEAIKWAGAASTNAFRYSKAESLAVLSMAQFKSGQTNEARNALASCSETVETKFPKLDSGNLGTDWRDWIIAQALRGEAGRLIDQSLTPDLPFTVVPSSSNNSNARESKF